jgi:hypothetical protein
MPVRKIYSDRFRRNGVERIGVVFTDRSTGQNTIPAAGLDDRLMEKALRKRYGQE